MSFNFNPLSYPILFSTPREVSGASTWVEHIPFGMLLTQLASPRVLVELGTYFGDSYLAFCHAVSELHLPTRCHAIDTWRGDQHNGFYDDSVFTQLKSIHDEPFGSFSTLVRSEFDVARDSFQDGQIDLLHIDGLHTYDAVKHDFETWLPKLSERAIVLFHDTQERDRNFGVWKLWEELSTRYPNFEFHHGHGLGVLVVGTDAPADALGFVQFANENPDLTRALFLSLGARFEGLHQLLGVGMSLAHQSECFQAFCTATQQPWNVPTALPIVVANAPACAKALAQSVEQVLKSLQPARPQ